MERKTVNVMSDVKESLAAVKSELGLSNDSDTVKLLIHIYRSSGSIPVETLNKLMELRK